MSILVIERKLRRKGAKWQPLYPGVRAGGGTYSIKEAKRDIRVLSEELSEYDWRLRRYARLLSGDSDATKS